MSTLFDNPRYVQYARVNGNTPEAQLEQDRKAWPGGSMFGYVFWNKARLLEYVGVNRDAFIIFGKLGAYDSYQPPHLREESGADYDHWLTTLPEGHGLPV